MKVKDRSFSRHNMGMRQEVLGYSVQGRYLGRTAKAKMGTVWYEL